MTNRLKGILYDILLFFVRIGFRQTGAPKLLIVKIDEIGDYMLWRAFLDDYVNCDRFKDYEIHFCGNASWKSLFDLLDNGKAKKEYWLEKIKFKKDMHYRYSFLKSIYKEGYTVVINPLYSRSKRIDDAIVRVASAKRNIGMKGNTDSIHSYEIGYDKNLYQDIFDYPQKPLFEFTRNKLFTEYVTQQVSSPVNTLIDTDLLPAMAETLSVSYFIVFPGSRNRARIWPTENFLAVSEYLYMKYGWTAVLAGAAGDIPYTTAFAERYKHPYIDVTIRTSLPAMLSILKNAQCLLSVDTGSIHLAASVACPTFGIFNGSQYGRFAPYPKEISDTTFAIYPDRVEQEVKDEHLLHNKYEFVIHTPYCEVSPKKVIAFIEKRFSGNPSGQSH